MEKKDQPVKKGEVIKISKAMLEPFITVTGPSGRVLYHGTQSGWDNLINSMQETKPDTND